MAARLITQMFMDESFYPAMAYVKRSTEEQQAMFKKGASKLDGIKKRSAHQDSLAMDIDLYDLNGTYLPEWPQDFSKKYHDLWESWGGVKVISWDQGHFEWPR
jgi:hypothetical protein